MLDVKVLPDRAAYALSHRGIALELSAALNVPLVDDPLARPVPAFSQTDALSVAVDDAYVLRHMGAIVRGVKVGESPAWLTERLESVGQRSINNIVDATNFVMLNIGQPLHAFDLGAITKDGDITRISIRVAAEGEQVRVLTGDTYTLSSDMYVVADATSGVALDIAGLKGGADSGVTQATTDLFISVGTYNPTLIRKMSQKLKLWTDASLRYQNKLSPELAPYGMRDILALITEIAGGEVVGVVDVYPHPHTNTPVSVSVADIEKRLGAHFTNEEIASVFDRLLFTYAKEGEVYTVTPPFERRDIVLPEDLIEEVGRLVGYERIAPTALPDLATPPDQSVFFGIERLKDVLAERGYTEVSTQSFATEGAVALANPLDQSKPWLRATLVANIEEALARAVHTAPRVFGPTPEVRLFELGTIFTKEGEHTALCVGRAAVTGKLKSLVLDELIAEIEQWTGSVPRTRSESVVEFLLTEEALRSLGAAGAPHRLSQGSYTPFSLYPAAIRDVAVWVPEGTTPTEVSSVITGAAGEYLARIDLFDTFQKEGRVSYAYRLVFESFDRTLADTDLDPAMARVTAALGAQGFDVR